PRAWRCAAGRGCPARRAGLARPGGVGEAPRGRWRASGAGGVAVCRGHARPRRRGGPRPVPDRQNPFYHGDRGPLTQTLGWTDAWTSQASAYAVLAQSGADVAAAVNFAREHRVRLVVKGGGHSYVGGSNAPDSLLIWTRPNMRAVQLHDRFVPRGAAGLAGPEAAVSVGAGAIWMGVCEAVPTTAGALCAW